mmetsp:Transcript_94987/g.273405  ORF Transcript_94987/g.273405 Transcript_94987/m.273405 type:complete len:265 (-) Transcript_94987:2326-3120(-)
MQVSNAVRSLDEPVAHSVLAQRFVFLLSGVHSLLQVAAIHEGHEQVYDAVALAPPRIFAVEHGGPLQLFQQRCLGFRGLADRRRQAARVDFLQCKSFLISHPPRLVHHAASAAAHLLYEEVLVRHEFPDGREHRFPHGLDGQRQQQRLGNTAFVKLLLELTFSENAKRVGDVLELVRLGGEYDEGVAGVPLFGDLLQQFRRQQHHAHLVLLVPRGLQSRQSLRGEAPPRRGRGNSAAPPGRDDGLTPLTTLRRAGACGSAAGCS